MDQGKNGFQGGKKETFGSDKNICYLAIVMLSQKATYILSYSNNMCYLLKITFKHFSKICNNYTNCRRINPQ